jgi:hypothetical protein
MGEADDWIDLYLKTIVAPCVVFFLLLIVGALCLAFYFGTKI